MGGDDGPRGEDTAGEEGVQGNQGQRGVPGTPGLPGEDAPDDEGECGMSGPIGEMGPPGPQGPPGCTATGGYTGSRGEPGVSGTPGPPGDKGEKGNQGANGMPGWKGRDGQPGYPGSNGPDGNSGDCGPLGPRGIPGSSGEVGPPGEDGYDGITGRPGRSGLPGQVGEPGDDNFTKGITGLPGQIGAPGDQGQRGLTTGGPYGFVFTIHSQTTQIPICPANGKLLWSGYSYMGNQNDKSTNFQDLGSTGSCMPVFSQVLKMSNCAGGRCNDEQSFWLATDEGGWREDKDDVSRCAVCEVPTVPLTIHHQQTKPKCPSGYNATFQGHSLLTISTGNSNEFITQDAASTGSCLQKYTSETVIKCNERSCTRSSPDDTLWIGELFQFEQNEEDISSCSVCLQY